MSSENAQVDYERLGAYFDGELDPVEARQVAQLIATDKAWAAAYAELEALDDTLDAYQAPAPPAELAGRIIAASRHEHRPLATRVLRIALPVAAAAAIAIAAVLVWPVIHGPSDQATQTANAQAVETLASENLDFFTNMQSMETLAQNESLLNDETMAALATMESPRQGS